MAINLVDDKLDKLVQSILWIVANKPNPRDDVYDTLHPYMQASFKAGKADTLKAVRELVDELAYWADVEEYGIDYMVVDEEALLQALTKMENGDE